MIDLNHQYALLEDGTIEELFYGFGGEPRDAYQDEDGKFYLDHDRPFRVSGALNGALGWAMRHSEIIATANNRMCLEAMPEYKGEEEEDTEFTRLLEKIMGGEDGPNSSSS